jgi:hypothetical protein
MRKTEALANVTEASRDTIRAKQSGIPDLSELKKAWWDAVETARNAGATEREIRFAEKEGLETDSVLRYL